MANTPSDKSAGQIFASGADELRAARKESRSLYWAVGIFSVFVNILMLTGPLYMLQVYDRVLNSRSVATLVALTAIMAFMFLMMGLLDFVRSRVMARVGAKFQARLDKRVFEATLRQSSLSRADPNAAPQATGLRDLEAVQKFMISPALLAFFDLPWTPAFLFLIFTFHPWMGYLALGGGIFLACVTVANQYFSRNSLQRSASASHMAELRAEHLRGESETVQTLGMREAAFNRWNEARDVALKEGINSSDWGGGFTTMSKTSRLFLQSLILGLGAYLVLLGELNPGMMIAGSIIFGRAMAPVDILLNQWPLVQRAFKGWDSLAQLLDKIKPDLARTALPKPRAHLEATQLTIVPPGMQQASLRLISFNVEPGQALGVIGPSGAGKSTLARAITGLWRPAGGRIRLDGATLDQYNPDTLGQHIGYLPQRVQLFEGTIAQNIARLEKEPNSEKVIEAARRAAAHEMILRLPDGYDTLIGANGGQLSGGQVQRIGLARALFSEPVILVLDEPNANLDNEGSEALNRAVRAMKADGRSAIIMAHRPAAIQECEVLMVLDNGVRTAYGAKDDVLRQMVSNHEAIRSGAQTGSGGGAV